VAVAKVGTGAAFELTNFGVAERFNTAKNSECRPKLHFRT